MKHRSMAALLAFTAIGAAIGMATPAATADMVKSLHPKASRTLNFDQAIGPLANKAPFLA